MKLFGGKNKDEQENSFAEEMADESFDTADADLGATEDDSLSAPNRDLDVATGRRGGAKKGILAGGLAVLLLGGAGGAYFYYTELMAEPEMPRVAKIVKPAAEAAAQNAPVPTAIDVTSDVLGEGVPPMPAAPVDSTAAVTDPTAPAPIELNADITAGAPADVTAAVPAAATAQNAPADISFDPDALATAPAATTPAAADAAAALGAPPADTAVPALPVETTAAADAAAAPDVPATGLVDAFAPVVVPEGTPAAAPPKSDLPMPRLTETPAVPAAAPAPTAVPAATAAASNAEKAIVENAAMLDQLSTPAPGTAADPAAAGKRVTEILGQPAVVRPMPDSYVIVRKEKDGGALDSRLKTARSALMQNRDMAALQLFNEMYEDYPRDNRVLMGRALAMQKMGQNPPALAAYEEILSSDPKNLEALTNMLGILKVENPALALEKLTELREAYPFNADIVAQLGVAHAGVKSYAEALKYLDMAEALRPGNGYVLYNKAVLYDRMGNEQQAAALYRQLVRLAAEGHLSDPIPLDAVRRRLSTMR